MRLAKYLRQQVTYRPFSDASDYYGNREYGPEQILFARKEERQRAVRNQQGAEYISEATVLLEEEIQVGELLDGKEIQARENYVDKRGRVVGWRAFL